VVRPGFDGFLETVARAGGRLWLASGGFDFYIEGILGERLTRFERAYFNRSHFADGRIRLDFCEGVECSRCAVCKGRVCDLARDGGDRVVFIGDGASDRCAIGKADLICAVQGSLLHRGCAEVEHRAFTSFDELKSLF
jgi:2-hydroxy-3-keto-5-methylthiopentenyl-1-phosphate phosphatase